MAMADGSRIRLVALLSAAVFSSMTVAVMMGPLLVALASAFDTSVASAGQLAAAIGISWGITGRWSARCPTFTAGAEWR
jgi:predicted MFS family arabinose efflux permease